MVVDVSAGSFALDVDYDRPLEEALVSAKLDWWNPGVTPLRFPDLTTGRRRLVLSVVRFPSDVSHADVLAHFRLNAMKPAGLRELLALSEQNQGRMQSRELLVGLGSTWVDRRAEYCPTLHARNGRLSLHIELMTGMWASEICAFAGMCEV